MHMTPYFSNGNQRQNMQSSNIFKLITLSVFITIFGFILIGCNSDSSSGENATGLSSELIEGVFVDSPVSGLNYSTPTQSGLTNENGQFYCYSDEMITFMIGDVILGQTMAGDVVTPMDFLNASEQPYDVTHPMVTNMGRFLQSLDADGDPDNGITITEEVRNEINGRMIDFNQSIEDFENDPDVIACFDVFNGLNMPRGNMMMWGLTSTEDAQQHMISYMGEYMSGGMNNQMDFEDTDEDGDADHPMNEYMDEEMVEYMNDHMDFEDTDGDGDIDHPMEEYMGEEMVEYMNDHMNFEDGDGDIDHPMDEYMGRNMGNRMGM